MKIDYLFVSKEALKYPITQNIIKERKYEISTLDQIREKLNSGKIEKSRALLISTFPGNFIKDCPCTPGYVSCGYKNINFAYNCPLNCSYCILQEYLTYPILTLFVNINKLKNEITDYKKSHEYIRIGTGELTDSLIWEKLYPFSQWFINLFQQFKDIIFEFKTKTDFIENFPELNKNENIIVSFSLNPEQLKREELYSVTPQKRIEAMKKLIKMGYAVGIHFDPLIEHENWEQNYKTLIKNIFDSISPKKIAWISLGSLRFTKDLRWQIKDNHPHSILLKGELIEGFDKKYRYPFLLREKLYGEIIRFLKEYGAEDLPIYFCMESEEMWKRFLKVEPETEKINKYLYDSAKKALKAKI